MAPQGGFGGGLGGGLGHLGAPMGLGGLAGESQGGLHNPVKASLAEMMAFEEVWPTQVVLEA